MALSDRQVKGFKPSLKDQWYPDEKCLRLLVKANGKKYWRMSYRFAGKQKMLALGIYPDVSLKQVRLERDKARLQIAECRDPAAERVAQREATKHGDSEKFSTLAKQWREHQRGTWTEDHA